MSIEYILIPEIDLCYAEWVGEIGEAEIIANFVQYMREPLYRPGRPELVDLRRVTRLAVSMNSLRSLLSRVNAQDFAGEQGTLTVVLADSDASYGHARQYQTLASLQEGIEVRVVRDERSALDELGRHEASVAELLAAHAPGWRAD